MQLPTKNESRAVVMRVAQQQEHRRQDRQLSPTDLLPKTDHFQGPAKV